MFARMTSDPGGNRRLVRAAGVTAGGPDAALGA